MSSQDDVYGLARAILQKKVDNLTKELTALRRHSEETDEKYKYLLNKVARQDRLKQLGWRKKVLGFLSFCVLIATCSIASAGLVAMAAVLCGWGWVVFEYTKNTLG